MELKSKIGSFLTSLKTHWNTPAQGRFVPYKETAAVAVGGMGVKFIVYCVSNMVISIGNVLIGNTIGIKPSAMYVIYIISILSGFPLTAIRADMIDNTRSMKGKYLPYILKMGIPSVLLGIGFIWAPYENMSMPVKCVTVLAFNIAFQFFYNFYNDAYESLINVISPNTIERTDIYAVRSVVENFSPSIAGIFLPIAARLITGSNTLYDLRVYRALYPPMLAVGFLVSMLVYANAKERTVQPKNRVIRVRFTDAFRAVAMNKYFWIISLAGWIGFLEGSFGQILGWMYNYQSACSSGQYSLITAIYGNASLWPNLFGPALIRRYGKKKVLIISNLLNIFLIALLLPVIRLQGGGVIWILLCVLFSNQLITSLGHFLGPSLNADVRDYQQYITGERIDGMFAAVGLIGNIITLVTSSVLPAIYERAGLNESVAASLGIKTGNVYDVLYDPMYFRHICSVLIIASVIGAALNVIPYFFYDLTESGQKAMVTVMRLRALTADLASGAGEENLESVREIIRSAKEYEGRQPESERGLKGARLKEVKAENEKIEISRMVLEELNKFNTPEGREALERARAVYAAGPDGFIEIIPCDIRSAKALPHKTPAERRLRRAAVKQARDEILAEKARRKYFPDGKISFDGDELNSLFERYDMTESSIKDTLDKIKAARESGDKTQAVLLKKSLASLRSERRGVNTLIEKKSSEYSEYTRAVKPYLDAEKLIEQYDGYLAAVQSANA